MSDEQNHLQRATEIVAAYFARNQVAADQLPSLISTVHQALGQLGEPTTESVAARTPAVSARQSVHRDYVVCMDCGWKGRMLKRHLMAAHGLSVEQYRARWSLPRDHAMTAPAYSERRSLVAKQFGLGRNRGASAEMTVVPETETATASQPKRRGRPRSVAASA
jgi:predicted transcriptional regulator